MNRIRNTLVALACLVASVASVPGTANAQEPPVPGDRATSFQAVEGTSREQVSGFNLMVGAYGLVWLFTTAFLVRLGRLQAKTAADVARLEAVLREESPKV